MVQWSHRFTDLRKTNTPNADTHATNEDIRSRVTHTHTNTYMKTRFLVPGDADCIRCYFCGGGLRRWTMEDDAWVEHARWFPKCQLVQERKGPEFVEAVTVLSKHYPQISLDMVRNSMLNTAMNRH
ncbi:baculoviral iap repeat-containing protein 7 [Plakobranchus ocellatus]|uniref:Baculoviral iap repeat-containing protein 7 n=1 Tax=Plakobranchus ocellatus TaxID=259542 RepID=A0AAV4D8U7_9GAST|nr:baculoviral iap repeat-containing protein 7 [Plakobranchus ocellatus]